MRGAATEAPFARILYWNVVFTRWPRPPGADICKALKRAARGAKAVHKGRFVVLNHNAEMLIIITV